MDELKTEKYEFYLFLKRNNHLTWCKAKIRRRFVIFIRRNYTMPLYLKQKKEYELQLEKEKEEVELQLKKEKEEVEQPIDDTKFKRIYKIGIKSYAYKSNLAKKEIYINSEWFYYKASKKELEKMEETISIWEQNHSERINRGGKADWNYHVISTLQSISRNFTFDFSNRMTRTCYSIKKRSPYNTHFTISQKWWETATDEDLQKFNRKIIQQA